MTGYDRKSMQLAHDADEPVNFTVQVDISGDGVWVSYQIDPRGGGTDGRSRIPGKFRGVLAADRSRPAVPGDGAAGVPVIDGRVQSFTAEARKSQSQDLFGRRKVSASHEII